MAKLIGSYEIEYANGEEWVQTVVRQEEGVAALSKAFRLASGGDLAGEEIAWPRADGYARYLIAKEKPLQLIHLAVGDAWAVEDALIRGLRRKDARQLVARRKALSSVFAVPSNDVPDSELSTVVEAGIEAAQTVVDCWQGGDLAGAVTQLEDWATQAADYQLDIEATPEAKTT